MTMKKYKVNMTPVTSTPSRVETDRTRICCDFVRRVQTRPGADPSLRNSNLGQERQFHRADLAVDFVRMVN